VCVAAAGGRLAVDELLEVLWPETPTDVARRRLPNILTRVRERCGSLLVRDGGTVALAAGVEVDLAAFELAAVRALEAVRHGAVEAEPLVRTALAGWSGDPLPEHRYEDWAAAPRERARRRLLELLDAAVGLQQEVGDPAAAGPLLERAIELDPYDDRRYLLAARLQLAAGNHGAAARWCDRADEVLAELALAAPPALREVRASIARSAADGVAS
jgi:DNA-binding SARP family transcriptional activator